MYGWRARLGVILPLDNAVLEPEFQRIVPEGVSVHVLRLSTGDREVMLEQAKEMAEASRAFGPDVLLYACAETSFFKGVTGASELESSLGALAGRPVVSATNAMLQALRRLGIRRPAVATPYPQQRSDQLAAVLGACGFEVASCVYRCFDDEVGDEREWWGVNIQHPTAAYRLGRDALHHAVASAQDPDGIVVGATNFRTFEVIDVLEKDTGLPVITSNQALLWASLREIGIVDPLPLGRLGVK